MSDIEENITQEAADAIENHREDQAFKYYQNAWKCSHMMY